MPFMCAICRDSLDTGVTDLNISQDESFAVATSCGHLFHYNCLPKKFTVSKGQNGTTSITFKPGDSRAEKCTSSIKRLKETLKCGTCSVTLAWIMRIFPAEVSSITNDVDLKKQVQQENEIFALKARLRAMEMSKGAANRSSSPVDSAVPLLQINRNTSIIAISVTEGGLKVGDRVVWCYDTVENGTVKWLGTIDGVSYAGVEFDQAIGNYTRRHSFYPDINCKENHGKLLRIQELMTYADFYG